MAGNRTWLLIAITLALCAVVSAEQASTNAASVGCLDEAGKVVDWWITMKGPRRRDSKDPRLQVGQLYLYGDANTFKTRGKFTEPKEKLGDDNSALARTIKQTYSAAQSNSPNAGWIVYNDQLTNGTGGSNYAHAKGVIHLDKASQGGYWIIHSMPKFPAPPQPGQKVKFEIPESASIFGQSMLCMSLDFKNLDLVFKQLQYFNPLLWSTNISEGIRALMPNAAAFITSTRINIPTLTSVPISTRGGQVFTHFAKNRQWGKDLYRDAIAPSLKVGLAVETWMRPYEPSYLKPTYPYDVTNVATLGFPFTALSYVETNDHSKYAISLYPNQPWVCIGDINKQPSQYIRGGGSACINNKYVHQAMSAMIMTVEPYTKPTAAQLMYPGGPKASPFAISNKVNGTYVAVKPPTTLTSTTSAAKKTTTKRSTTAKKTTTAAKKTVKKTSAKTTPAPLTAHPDYVPTDGRVTANVRAALMRLQQRRKAKQHLKPCYKGCTTC